MKQIKSLLSAGINDKCFKVIHISFAEQIGGFITVELK